MRARIGIALGLYWSGIAQVMIVIASISALGAVGGLPALVGALTKYRRFPMSWVRGLRPLAVLFGLSLLTLQGCAQTVIRERSHHPKGTRRTRSAYSAPISASRPSPRKVSRGASVHSARDSLSTSSHSPAAAPTAPLAQVRWSV